MSDFPDFRVCALNHLINFYIHFIQILLRIFKYGPENLKIFCEVTCCFYGFSLQQGDEHSKAPHLRHRESWSSTKGILSPRAPKQQHRLSVDANLQIPKELTLASKRELLQKVATMLLCSHYSPLVCKFFRKHFLYLKYLISFYHPYADE